MLRYTNAAMAAFRVARESRVCKTRVLVLDPAAKNPAGQRETPDARRRRRPSLRLLRQERGRKASPNGLAGIRTQTSRLQGERASKLHHEPATSGTGVEPARPQGPPG